MARAAGDLPVVAYDVPGRTGITIREETVKRLAEIANIVALKDATLDLERAERLARDTDLAILSGDDAATLAMMRTGAKGVVSVAANVVPAAMARLCSELDAGVHEQLSALFKALFVQSNPIPTKWALAEMGPHPQRGSPSAGPPWPPPIATRCARLSNVPVRCRRRH